ncbi:MAG TPA: hypothetical protein VN611_05240 [Patescibacteria group bacterium]|nr:hypothetical protein [Patescibacteria group bacterium]
MNFAKILLLILLGNLVYTPLSLAEPIYQTVAVPKEKMVAVLRLLDDTAARLGVTYSVFNASSPEIVLRGESESLQQMTLLLEECRTEDTVNDLINISCSLHSLQEGDLLSLGFLPPSGVQASGYVQRNNTSVDIWELALSTLENSYLKLQQTLNKGTTVISGDITTTNGLRGELTTKQSLPLSVTTGVINTTSVTYKDVVTEVKVTPTILAYNSENPPESKVRLDIHVKISNVNKTTNSSTTYPYIASREYDMTRIVKANNQPYITAAIVRDKQLKTTAGIPVLKDLPLLKYLFSSDYNRNVREYDILKINVAFLPLSK